MSAVLKGLSPVDRLRADAERALGLHIREDERVVWKSRCAYRVGPDQRLRFYSAPTTEFGGAAVRVFAVMAACLLGGVSVRLTGEFWLGVTLVVLVLAGQTYGWWRERSSHRAEGRAVRVEVYALTLTRLVYIAAESGGTQAWAMRAGQLSQIMMESDLKGPWSFWVAGTWFSPDGQETDTAIAFRHIKDPESVARRLHRALAAEGAPDFSVSMVTSSSWPSFGSAAS